MGEISPLLAALPEYLAAHGIRVRPADLSNHECVYFLGTKLQDMLPLVDENGTNHSIPIGGRIICQEIMTLYTAVCSDLGIGLLPRAALIGASNEGILSQVLPACKIASNPLYAVIPAGRNKVPRTKLVADWLAQFVKSLDSQ